MAIGAFQPFFHTRSPRSLARQYEDKKLQKTFKPTRRPEVRRPAAGKKARVGSGFAGLVIIVLVLDSRIFWLEVARPQEPLHPDHDKIWNSAGLSINPLSQLVWADFEQSHRAGSSGGACSVTMRNITENQNGRFPVQFAIKYVTPEPGSFLEGSLK